MRVKLPDERKKISVNDRGFNLIEIMIAMGIFAIGFLAVAQMQIGAMNTTNSARETTEAMTLAENQAEWLRALPFYDRNTDLNGSPGDDTYDIHPDLAAASETAPHEDDVAGPLTVRWSVTYDQPLPANTMLTDEFGNPVMRSMMIRVWVTPDNDPADIRSEIEFAKFAG